MQLNKSKLKEIFLKSVYKTKDSQLQPDTGKEL